MSNDGFIIEDMDLSYINLAVLFDQKYVKLSYANYWNLKYQD